MTDYSQYFLDDFTELFKQLVTTCESTVKSEKVLESIKKVSSIINDLNYSKIAIGYSENSVLQRHLIFLNQNGFEKKCFGNIMNDKCWKIVPAMNLCLIFLHTETENRQMLYNLLYQLYSCACMYAKALENNKKQNEINDQINAPASGDVNEFNPFQYIGEDGSNITIDDMFKNAQQRSYLPHEVLLNLMGGSKIATEFENMDELQLMQQTNGLSETLNSTDFDPNSAKFLQDILAEIYPELINIKNAGATKGMTDRQSADLISSLAQRLANKLIKERGLDENNLDPEKLFESTQKLASNYIDNPMLLGMMNMFKQHIVSQKKELYKELKAHKRHKRPTTKVENDELTNLLGCLD